MRVGRTLIEEEAIQQRLVELGAEITADYAGGAPLLVGVLKGAVLFTSDLCRAVRRQRHDFTG